MANAYLQGIQGAFDNQAEVRNNIYVVASNWFVNRCPLVTRVPRVPTGSTTFTIVSRSFRPRVATLAAAVAAGDTQIALADASPFMNGDVLELASGERVELIGDPNLVDQHRPRPPRRGRDDARHRRGQRRDPADRQQPDRGGDQPERRRHEARRRDPVLPDLAAPGPGRRLAPGLVGVRDRRPGVRTPFEQYKMDALQNLMDDMEYSSYYGRGEDPAVAARPKQKGLQDAPDRPT